MHSSSNIYNNNADTKLDNSITLKQTYLPQDTTSKEFITITQNAMNKVKQWQTCKEGDVLALGRSHNVTEVLIVKTHVKLIGML